MTQSRTPQAAATSAQSTELALHRLRCQVKLGCEAWERKETQSVLFDVTFRFPSVPAACWTDELDTSVCYAEVSSTLEAVCRRSEYRLIERLGFEAFAAVKEHLPAGVSVWLKVTKEKPPVPNLEGGASFQIGDSPSS